MKIRFKKAVTLASALCITIGAIAFKPERTLAMSESSTISTDFTSAIKNDGSLWHYNYSSGKHIKLADGVACVAGNAIVKTDGSFWEWGYPTRILEMPSMTIKSGVKYAMADGSRTIMLKTDDSLWAWGTNAWGSLGDGTETERKEPVKIMDNVASFSLGFMHSMAIKKDGSLWTWGRNEYGQLGLGYASGPLEGIYSPVKVMEGVASVAAGYGHTVVLKTDGTLWTWGMNSYGQLGNGTYSRVGDEGSEKEVTPSKIMDNVAFISADAFNTAAIKKDGSLWVWGMDSERQTGDGSTPRRVSPVKIMDGAAAVSIGESETIALKTDGTLWFWRDNPGFGTSVSAPTKIMDDVRLPSNAVVPEKETPFNSGIAVSPTKSTVFINGKSIGFDAYLINGSNHFKLRDIAAAINGTEKQFDVSWDATKNTINLIKGRTYTKAGGELEAGTGKAAQASSSRSAILKDGTSVTLEAYTINGSNYFKLRDIGKLFDFGINYNESTAAIDIDTSKSYTESAGAPTEIKSADSSPGMTDAEKNKLILDSILAPGMSEYEKEKAIYDYLAVNLEYINAPASYVIYVEAFKELLDSAGIENFITTDWRPWVSGGLTDANKWNLVKIDGEWYNVDMHWPVKFYNYSYEKEFMISYEFFNKTDEYMSRTHQIDGSYNRDHEEIVCSSKKYEDFTLALNKEYQELVEELAQLVSEVPHLSSEGEIENKGAENCIVIDEYPFELFRNAVKYYTHQEDTPNGSSYGRMSNNNLFTMAKLLKDAEDNNIKVYYADKISFFYYAKEKQKKDIVEGAGFDIAVPKTNVIYSYDRSDNSKDECEKLIDEIINAAKN